VCYVCIAFAASVYAVNNPGHMSKRGSSGRSSARGCAVLSPVSRTPHSSSSGMYLCTAYVLCDVTFQLQRNLVDVNCLYIGRK